MVSDHSCPRCGGLGKLDKFNHVQDGICFECSGKGKVTQEEYDRIEKSIAKDFAQLKKSIDKNQQRLKKSWFNDSDSIYIVNQTNTYEIKDQLKQDGAKFNDFKVWYFTEPKKGYDLFRITWNEVLNGEYLAETMREIIKKRSDGQLKGY